jgi:hypothetical protein
MFNSASRISSKEWRNLYVAALQEGDQDRVPSLIAEAERAIVDRAQEVFKVSGDEAEEKDALSDALYCLFALRSSLETYGGFAEAA